MSVFVGEHLSRILDQVEEAEEITEEEVRSIDLGLSQLPDIKVDNTDRNRTSPFAFTGNKFEFRAVGSNQSISIAVAVLNAAVADSLNEMNGEMSKLKTVDEKTVIQLLRKFIKRSKPIRFEGNNYSEDWVREAEARGLPNNMTTPEAYSVWLEDETRQFVNQIGLLNEQEMDARYHVRLEHYCGTIGIEASLLISMTTGYVLPCSLRYQRDLADAIRSLKDVGGNAAEDACAEQEHLLQKVSDHIGRLLSERAKLEKLVAQADGLEDVTERAMFLAKKVCPQMEVVRGHADALESLVEAKAWPLPTYHQLLFLM
jgi:glutamine synthetase